MPDAGRAALLYETLGDMLRGLKAPDRSVVLLRLQGYEVAEISQEVGYSERTVYHLLEKVRARLKAAA